MNTTPPESGPGQEPPQQQGPGQDSGQVEIKAKPEPPQGGTSPLIAGCATAAVFGLLLFGTCVMSVR